MVAVIVLRGVILFKRGTILDKEVSCPATNLCALPFVWRRAKLCTSYSLYLYMHWHTHAPIHALSLVHTHMHWHTHAPIHALSLVHTHTHTHTQSLQKFNSWLDSKLSKSPIPGMLVYPEGVHWVTYNLRVHMCACPPVSCSCSVPTSRELCQLACHPCYFTPWDTNIKPPTTLLASPHYLTPDTYTRTHTYQKIHTHTHTHTHTRIHANIHKRAHTKIRTRIHTVTHIRTCTHTHTYTLSSTTFMVNTYSWPQATTIKPTHMCQATEQAIIFAPPSLCHVCQSVVKQANWCIMHYVELRTGDL